MLSVQQASRVAEFDGFAVHFPSLLRHGSGEQFDLCAAHVAVVGVHAEHFLGNVRCDGFDPSGDAVPIVFVGFTGVGWRGLGCWLFRFQMDKQRGLRSAGMTSDFGFRWFHFDRLVLFGFLDLIHGERERCHGESEHEPVHATFRRELFHSVDDAGGVRMGDVWAVVHNRVQSALVFLMGEEDEWCEGSTRLCHSLEALADLIVDFTNLTVT